jgi:spore coat polysaccharide biosynthesis protein SpsF
MNIGALIPIRLRSERLPNKALMEIGGRPVFHHLLDRVCACKHIKTKQSVIVCTTDDPSDDPLVQSIENYGCSVFRGDKNDIIKRFYSAMEAFDLDYVVQVDGDDPLTATEYMDITMDVLLADTSLDIVTVDGLPLGCASKSFSRRAIKKVFGAYLSKENDTGFIYFFTKTGLCNHHIVRCKNPHHQHPNARLTLDYPEDFELFTKIFDGAKRSGHKLNHEGVVKYLNEHKDLCDINSYLDERYLQRTIQKANLQYLSSVGHAETIKV